MPFAHYPEVECALTWWTTPPHVKTAVAVLKAVCSDPCHKRERQKLVYCSDGQ